MLLTVTSTVQAGLIGKELTVEYFLPSLGTPYSSSHAMPQTFTVGPGVETVVKVEDILSIAVDFDDDSVSLHFDKLSPYFSQWNSSPFNGLVFTLVGPGPLGISAFEITPSPYMPGFDASRVTVTASSIAFNWQGLRYDPDSADNGGDGIAVSARLVPEPGILALLGAGMLTLGATMRRRRPG
ncbi:MAG: PEP-CTERM sorting domain-containing protein [Geminicoccaceae bacterium]